MIERDTLSIIEDSLDYARFKHPEFTDTLAGALLLAQEELGEAIRAFNDHSVDKDFKEVYTELGHTIAVCIRILDGEWLKHLREQISNR